MHIRSLFNCCLLLAALTPAAGAWAEQPADKPLKEATIELRPGIKINGPTYIQCAAGRRERCSCTINNFLSTKAVTLRFRATDGDFGVSSLDDEENNAVHISCVKINGPAVSPTVWMIRAAFGENCVKKATFDDGTRATKEDLQTMSETPPRLQSNDRAVSSFNLKENERRMIEAALKASNGDREQAAKQLGITGKALLRKLKER